MESDELRPPGANEVKDNQWLGVTVRSGGVGEKVMVSRNYRKSKFVKGLTKKYVRKKVCAHRHIVKAADSQWGQGQCYILTQDLKFQELKKPCSGKPTVRYANYFFFLAQN